MKFLRAKFLATGCVSLFLGLQMVRAQETRPVVLVSDNKRFLYYADTLDNFYVNGHSPKDATKDKIGFALDRLGITLRSIPLGVTELPEVKLEYLGTKYVLPAHKILVVLPRPKKQGVFAQVAPDPNGTGNYEVLLTINWPDWPDHEKQINLLRAILPAGLEVVGDGGGWGYPDDGLSWTKSLIFHNRTGRPFILDPGFFENLPTNQNWPDIVIPPAD